MAPLDLIRVWGVFRGMGRQGIMGRPGSIRVRGNVRNAISLSQFHTEFGICQL